MSLLPKKLSKDELGWFDLAKYAPARLKALSLVTWIQIVSDRDFLQRLLLLTDGSALLAKYFENIKTDPIAGLGSGKVSLLLPDTSDTASVELLRVNTLMSMAAIAGSCDLQGNQCYDRAVPPEASAGLYRRAHLSVDLEATKTQIKADFARWLSIYQPQRYAAKNRIYRTRIRYWATNMYLPYFDLTLFAKSQGATIKTSTMQEMLGLSGVFSWDAVKTAAGSTEVFNGDTLAAMRLEAGQG